MPNTKAIMLSTDAQVWATVIAYVGLVIGCAGIIVPVIPGSILNLFVLIGWGVAVNSTMGWSGAAGGILLTIIGIAASWVLTGNRLKKLEVPNRVIAIAALSAVVGMFALPGPGLLIGFVVGLFIAEWVRHSTAREALETTKGTLVAVGIGLGIELLCAGAAFIALTMGVFLHFTTV